MIYFSIWIGNPTEKITENLASNLFLMNKSDQYIIISEERFYDDNRIQWIDYADYIKGMLEDKNLVNFWSAIDSKNYEMKSDVIRFHYLSKNAYVSYMDFDVILQKKLLFKNKEKAVFGKVKKNRIDFFLIYNGSETELMYKILIKSISNIYIHILNKYNMKRSWIYNTINKDFKLNRIDNSYFRHGY